MFKVNLSRSKNHREANVFKQIATGYMLTVGSCKGTTVLIKQGKT